MGTYKFPEFLLNMFFFRKKIFSFVSSFVLEETEKKELFSYSEKEEKYFFNIILINNKIQNIVEINIIITLHHKYFEDLLNVVENIGEEREEFEELLTYYNDLQKYIHDCGTTNIYIKFSINKNILVNYTNNYNNNSFVVEIERENNKKIYFPVEFNTNIFVYKKGNIKDFYDDNYTGNIENSTINQYNEEYQNYNKFLYLTILYLIKKNAKKFNDVLGIF